MKDQICQKVSAMLSLFIDNKLNDDDNFFVETHLLKCGECYKKYIEMKSVMTNLHLEYEKLMDEFDKIEAENTFNIREYEKFYENISPYIDDELCYEDSIKFRKYLLSSKPARVELANAYGLRNSIKQSVEKMTNSLNLNYSKKILKRLKNENPENFENMYKRAAIALIIMVVSLLVLTFVGYKYMHRTIVRTEAPDIGALTVPMEIIEIPNENDLIEFTFDENGEPLLINK